MTGIPSCPAWLRDKPNTVPCPTCQQWGRFLRTDERGDLIEHPGRAFPCRVPPIPIGPDGSYAQQWAKNAGMFGQAAG